MDSVTTLRACTDSLILVKSLQPISREYILRVVSYRYNSGNVNSVLRAPLCMPEFVTFVKSDVSCFIDKGQRTTLLEKINQIVSQDRSVLFSEALLFRGRLTDVIGS